MKLFGTDGIRCKANTYPLVPKMVVTIGRAVKGFFKVESNEVVLGGDTRVSTGMLSSALSAGISSAGLDVLVPGVLPTPVIAWLTRELGARCGIVVSASHNPWYDNGIKFFTTEGYKLTEEEEEKFEQIIFALDTQQEGNERVGSINNLLDWEKVYLEHIKDSFNMELSKFKIVLDMANGATFELAPKVFQTYKADLVLLNNTPNGFNINKGCGATDPSAMCEAVKKHQADIGIAFDGDGDRVMLADEKGALVDGDAIIGIIAKYMHQNNQLHKAKVVLNNYSNLGLIKGLEQLGIGAVLVPTGDRFIAQAMREQGLNLGGEKSGHIILSDYETTGNGILTALMVLKIMYSANKKLSELNFITQYPQVLINVEVSKKPPLESVRRVMAVVQEVESELKQDGRVFIRYSGTQPVLRVMVEGNSKSKVEEYANRIAKVVKEELG